MEYTQNSLFGKTSRYGRKGDEADTAGKIKWYAQKLKELGERESE